MGTTLASVSGMVQRLAKEGLVNISKDKQIVLTAEGQVRARNVVRRHRLSERLLVDILDVSLDRAESVAHQLEHAISGELLDRIEAKLGFPETLPLRPPDLPRRRQRDPRRDTRLAAPQRDEHGTDVHRPPHPGRGLPAVALPSRQRDPPRARRSPSRTSPEYRGVVDLIRRRPPRVAGHGGRSADPRSGLSSAAARLQATSPPPQSSPKGEEVRLGRRRPDGGPLPQSSPRGGGGQNYI